MSHLAALEKEIGMARGDVHLSQAELDKHNRAIKDAVCAGEDEKAIEKRQLQRDLIARRHERLTLLLESLEAQRPAAAAKDVKEQLPEMEKAISAKVTRLKESYDHVDACWRAFLASIEQVEAAKKECADIHDRIAELQTLCIEHDIETPALPDVPLFREDIVFELRRTYELLNGLAVRVPILSQRVQAKLEAARQRQHRRRAEEWMSLPATERSSGPSVDIINAMTEAEREQFLSLAPVKPPSAAAWTSSH
jgi:hypothetical protein